MELDQAPHIQVPPRNLVNAAGVVTLVASLLWLWSPLVILMAGMADMSQLVIGVLAVMCAFAFTGVIAGIQMMRPRRPWFYVGLSLHGLLVLLGLASGAGAGLLLSKQFLASVAAVIMTIVALPQANAHANNKFSL